MESLNGKQQGGDSNLAIQAYIQDLLDIAIRRKWLIISIVILSVAISGVYAWVKPKLYRSTTVIMVEHQKIPENYVRSVVSGRVAERVSTITQQVLSRTSLQKVIEELQLFPQMVKEHGYDSAIGIMRGSVQLVTKGSRGRLDTFKISFSHSDPMTAMKVTAKLASQYIEENLKLREQFVEGASEFLEQELASIKRELDEKEKAMSEFKLRYLGELPGQLESNLRTLDRLQGQNSSLQESSNSLSMRLELIQKSIHDYESIAGALADLPADVPRGGPMDPLVLERQKIEKELAKLSMEYTDAYPDVVVLRHHLEKVITKIEENQDAQEDVVLEGETGDDSKSSMNTSLVSLDPYVLGLQNTRDDIKTQISSLKIRQKRVLADMELYKGRIERTPAREQELLILERDYANIQRNYQHLHGKRLNSRISENLEKRQKAERFRILDPANLPTKPDGPQRYLIVLAGLAVGVGLGYGSAFALEQWKPTFRRSEDAEVSIGFPILATIPSFQMAYGKSFKSLPHQSSELKNGHGEGSVSRSGYLGSVVPAKVSMGKVKDFKNGFPSELGLVTKWRPGSIVAEQYRVAATRLSIMGGDKSTSTVILVTSAMKNEGKTSTVANLAYTLARDLDEPTLVIDCDFKCPALHNVMARSWEPGLAEYFHGDEPLESCLHHIEGVPLWFIPVGNVEENTVPLSKLPHLGSVINTLKSRFRYILLDTPPILPLADINVLAGLAEILLLVVRSGRTPKDVVVKAADMLGPMAQSRIILTDAWSQGMPYYVRQGYEVPYAIGER